MLVKNIALESVAYHGESTAQKIFEPKCGNTILSRDCSELGCSSPTTTTTMLEHTSYIFYTSSSWIGITLDTCGNFEVILR